MQPTPEILRWRAACQEAAAAENRAWALFQETFPKGTPVQVYGRWRARVEACVMPCDGSVSVVPFPEDIDKLNHYERSEVDLGGRVMICAGSYDLIERPKAKRKTT